MPSASSMPVMATLSCSVKSTPLVWAPSRKVVSNRWRRSRVIAWVAPSWRAPSRRKPLFHGRVGEPFIAARHGVAALRHEAATLEEAARGVTGIDGQPWRAAPGGELLDRIAQHGTDPLPGDGRMNIEQIEAVGALERHEAHRRAAERGDERQLPRQPGAEGRVVGDGCPDGALRLAVILCGQLLDAGAKDFGEQRRIRRQIRPQRQLRIGLGAHRAISQVVSSFVSFTTMPIFSSSRRMRSASGKFLILLASLRLETNL